MYNPFEILEARLSNIENLLLDLKHPVPEVSPSIKYYTKQELEEIFGVSRNTITTWVKTGKLTGYRIGSRVRFKRSEVEASLKQIKSDLSYK